jgi:mannose-6-phosphate isomerase
VTLRPARLEAIFVPRIWGARNLAPLFPDKKSLAEPIGEVWLTGNECRFADGPFTGQKLGDAWPRMGDEWAGKNARRDRNFPWLVKFLFPEDKLSVQVHPDDEYAAKNEAEAGGVGKTEMWYVISARPGAEVRVGLKHDVTRERFRRAIADGTAEDCVEKIPVQAGDAIFVPAGTVHTIGPGMILCEIQENSDLTYRVFDFNRHDAQRKPRELHIEKAFDVIRFGKQQGGKVAQTRRKEGDYETSLLVDCPHFSATKLAFGRLHQVEKEKGQMELLVMLEGRGTLRAERGKQAAEYAPAQAWLVPAAFSELICEAREPTTLLRVNVPVKS